MPFLFLKYCLLVGVSLPVYSLDRSGMVTQPTIENCVGAQLRRVQLEHLVISASYHPPASYWLEETHIEFCTTEL